MAEAPIPLTQDSPARLPGENFTNRRNLTNQEQALANGKLGEPKALEGSRGRVALVDVEGAGRALVKWQEYSDVQCETAAFVVSDVLGFNLVPTTVIRDILGRQASLQEFIPNASLIYEVDQSKFEEDFYAVWIFDHIIRSNDRDEWNVLFQGQRLIAIDHEAAFYTLSSETDYDTFKTFYGQSCPEKVKQIFKRYSADPSIEKQLRGDLSGLLKEADIDETVRRINQIGNMLLQTGKIPSPDGMVKGDTHVTS